MPGGSNKKVYLLSALVSTTPRKGRALPIQVGLDGWVASAQGQAGGSWLHKLGSPLLIGNVESLPSILLSLHIYGSR
jgi:hypothetical protein